MSYAEASQMFSRYKQLVIGRNVSRDEEPSVSVLPSSQDASKYYKVKGTVNRKFLELRAVPGSGLIPSQMFSRYQLAWNEKLDWKQTQWQFHKKSSSKSAIRYGEPLAIGWDKWDGKNFRKEYSGYIRYGRRVGAILKQSKTKSFEWAILGGKPGEPVQRGRTVILYNLKHQQPLIYFKGKGNDVGWPDSADIKDSPQQTARMRAAAKTLLLPGVVVGK